MSIVLQNDLISKHITWDEISYIWKEYLWVGRKSKIESTNGLEYLEGFNKDHYNFHPTFFGVFHKDKLVGVNSGHQTTNNGYRSRGLYVFDEYRSNGVSTMLFEATEKQAISEDVDYIWSIPRKSSMYAYLNFGFKQTSDFFDGNMEFGPNAFVIKKLK